MSSEIDLSDEVEPTEQMIELQQQAEDGANSVENQRAAGHSGSVETEDFSVDEVLEQL